MKKKVLIVAVLLLVVFLVLISALLYRNKNKTTRSRATSASQQLDIQSDWQAGVLNNTSAQVDGSISLDDKGSANIDLVTLASENPSAVSATFDESDKFKLVDGNTSTYWESFLTLLLPQTEDGPDVDYYWQIDLGKNYNVTQIRVYTVGTCESEDLSTQTSTDGSSYTTFSDFFGINPGPLTGEWSTFSNDQTGRYIRILAKNENIWGGAPPCDGYTDPTSYARYGEIEVSADAFGTHTTGATQIDGGANFFEWESFTPTATVPANTSVTYKYRTSTDASTWTAWVSDIGSVTSRSGEDKYRYLQVEATLSNTDGASTPTIDSYNIGYHTNITPSTPTNLTAVVGE